MIFSTRTTHPGPSDKKPPNIKLDPTVCLAAHSVLRPLCLLRHPAAQFCVGPVNCRQDPGSLHTIIWNTHSDNRHSLVAGALP